MAKNHTSSPLSINEAIFCIKPLFQKYPAAIKRRYLYIYDLKFSINQKNSRSRSCLEMIRLIINTKGRRTVWKDEWTLIARETSKTILPDMRHRSFLVRSSFISSSVETLLLHRGAVFMSSFLSGFLPLKPSEVSPEAPQSEFIKVKDVWCYAGEDNGKKKKTEHTEFFNWLCVDSASRRWELRVVLIWLPSFSIWLTSEKSNLDAARREVRALHTDEGQAVCVGDKKNMRGCFLDGRSSRGRSIETDRRACMITVNQFVCSGYSHQLIFEDIQTAGRLMYNNVIVSVTNLWRTRLVSPVESHRQRMAHLTSLFLKITWQHLLFWAR